MLLGLKCVKVRLTKKLIWIHCCQHLQNDIIYVKPQLLLLYKCTCKLNENLSLTKLTALLQPKRLSAHILLPLWSSTDDILVFWFSTEKDQQHDLFLFCIMPCKSVDSWKVFLIILHLSWLSLLKLVVKLFRILYRMSTIETFLGLWSFYDMLLLWS